MADTIGKAFVDVGFDPSQIEGALGGLGSTLETKFGTIGEKASSALKSPLALGAAGVVAAGVVVGKALYDLGAQFDEMSDDIHASTGASGKDLDGLVKVAKQVGTDVPVSFKDAGKAVADLSQRMGATGKTLRGLADQELALSKLTGTDLSTNIRSTSRAFSEWGINAKDAGAALDKLFRASQQTGIPVATLADQLTKFGPAMKTFGLSFDQSTALLASFEKAGVNTGAAMAGLNKALSVAAKGGVKDLPKFLEDMIAKIKDAPSSAAAAGDAIKLFGAKAGPQLADAIRSGKLSVDGLLSTIESGHSTITGAEKDNEDFSESWKELKNKLEVAISPVAVAFFNALGDGMKYINANAPAAIAALKKFGSSLNLGPAVKDVAAALGSLGKVIGDIVHGDWSKAWSDLKQVALHGLDAVSDIIPAALKKLEAGFKDIGKGLLDALGLGEFAGALTNAIHNIFGGLARVFKGDIDVFKGVIKGDWSEVWSGLGEIATGILQTLAGAIEGAGTLIAAALTKLAQLAGAGVVAGFSALGKLLGDAATGLGSLIVSGITGGVSGLAGLVKSAVSAIPGALSALATDAGAAALSVGNAILNAITGAVTGIAATVAGFVGAIPGAIVALGSSAFATVASVGDWITKAITGAVSGIATAVANLVKAIPGAIVALGTQAFSTVSSVGTWLVTHIVDGVGDVAAKVVALVKAIPGAIVALGSKAFDTVSAVGGWIKAAVVTGVTGVGAKVVGLVKDVAGDVSGIPAKVFAGASSVGIAIKNAILDGLGDIGKSLANKVKAGINDVIGLVNGAIKSINSALSFTIPTISVDTHLPGVGKISFGGESITLASLPSIPRLGAGGIVTSPTTALIGEAGPEAVLPLSGRSSTDMLSALLTKLQPASSSNDLLERLVGSIEVHNFFGDREFTDLVDTRIVIREQGIVRTVLATGAV